MPIPDSDLLAMVKLFPVLLTDINYATMYQSFSIIYGIDVDDENLKLAPNSFWRFKSDPTSDAKKPEIGTIKPSVDTDKVIQLIQAQMSMWLQSRSIRPGNTGQLNTENFSSGISKIVDEMDTVEDRSKQVPFFERAEEQLFDLIINHLHPVWIKQPGYDTRLGFTAGARVQVEFQEQKPMQDFSKLIDDAIKLRDAGLITNLAAIKMIYPDLTESEYKELAANVESSITINLPTDQEEDQEEQTGVELEETNGGQEG